MTLTLAAALCLPALFAQKSAAEEPIVLTFNLGMPPIHQRWVNAIKPWCDELEKRSNGRIRSPLCFLRSRLPSGRTA